MTFYKEIDDMPEGKMKEFAVACYESNTSEELELCLKIELADETDCKEWGITSEEWFTAINTALNELIED